MSQRIFVYGTFRKGMFDYDLYLRDEAKFIGYGYVKGSLMHILARVYPAYLREGQDMILGEIHEISDQTLKKIDQVKGFISDDYSCNEFNRVVCEIYNEKGEIIDHLPVYEFNMDNSTNQMLLKDDIETHDYVMYMQGKKPTKKSVFVFLEDEVDENPS